jgi:hypothetical protein
MWNSLIKINKNLVYAIPAMMIAVKYLGDAHKIIIFMF